ncbi:hypothetical protein PSDT_0908 [Parascardovia denticolens DSM 10105 = JCM 12538]|nr:hypothetical protein PSDT_0908 [Parascardovia denticolens DSM 10105 = JCM 12538]
MHSRNICPLYPSPKDWNSLYTEFVENFIWQFIILFDKAKTSETCIHAESYQLLLSNIINSTEGSPNQTAKQITHNR